MDDASFFDLLDGALESAYHRWRYEGREVLSLLDRIAWQIEERRHELVLPAALRGDDGELHRLVRAALDRGWREVRDYERGKKQACLRGLLTRIGYEVDCRERYAFLRSLSRREVCA